MRIGIDVGGTFTDIVLINDEKREIFYTKTNTTTRDLSEGVITGIEKILAISSCSIDEVEYIVHGTTIGTNALIERKGAKTGLLTTEGFRDVLEIGRIQRPAEGLYDPNVDNPFPLIPRYLRLGINERIGSKGEVIIPIDENSAIRAIEFLKKEKVESIAVCFLFSFLNKTHENRVFELIKEVYPEAFISLSSQIAPEFREFERTSTTVINAYLLPIVRRYIDELLNKLERKFGNINLRIMIASGGSISAEIAKDYAVHTVNSGPAGGALAGSFIGELLDCKKLITVDMGGTSFDISITDQGMPKVTGDGKFEDYPVRIPIIDLSAIGAGGGSIAWIDKGGVLNVGPQSAGSEPGPVCYKRGGMEPTVTDANLVLGRLNPDYFLGGELKLDLALSKKAIEEKVAKPLKMSLEEAAFGILRIVNANMIKQISVSSIEKGYDIREFSLVAFGGAGGLHAAEIALDAGLKRIISPPIAGDFSAIGLLISDTRHDYVQTIMKDEVDPDELMQIFKELENKGIKELEKQGISKDITEIHWSADLRFKGQSYEINTHIERKDKFSKDDIIKIRQDFNKIHERIYAYGSMDEEIEFVNLRVAAIGKSSQVQLPIGGRKGESPEKAKKMMRKVYFYPEGFINTAIYDREKLEYGNIIEGPAVIEETISSTLVPPKARATIDKYFNIIIDW
ncbi:hydantoinase/oxoprolinase family protein [bacterium]|nr:hydantoinase/oxoprolinase family protein [bacterium]